MVSSRLSRPTSTVSNRNPNNVCLSVRLVNAWYVDVGVPSWTDGPKGQTVAFSRLPIKSANWERQRVYWPNCLRQVIKDWLLWWLQDPRGVQGKKNEEPEKAKEPRLGRWKQQGQRWQQNHKRRNSRTFEPHRQWWHWRGQSRVSFFLLFTVL